MDDLRQDTFTEERVTRPLFMDRPNHQCCWPMWGEGVPIEDKRCCGALVSTGSKIPYCPQHLQQQIGRGTISETSADRVLAILSKKGA